jgi:hypothetical protein
MLQAVRLFLACTLMLGMANSLAAQVQTGSILIRVTDEQGGAVPGVSVRLTSSALVAGTATGVTDAGGAYRFPSLPPGVYSVTVELQGFQTIERENVNVQVGQTIPLDLTMRVASLAETVTVRPTSARFTWPQ